MHIAHEGSARAPAGGQSWLLLTGVLLALLVLVMLVQLAARLVRRVAAAARRTSSRSETDGRLRPAET